MSFAGTLEAIFITDTEGGEMRRLESATLVTNRGIEGDRYCNAQGKFSNTEHVPAAQQVTLIEAESIEAVQRDQNIDLEPAQSRRNLLTRGVPLNHLVDQDFRIGGVRLRGIKLCEPCGYLEKLTDRSDLRKALLHRGGLRAQIAQGGDINVGDTIVALGEATLTERDVVQT